jgi:hypothetical protein
MRRIPLLIVAVLIFGGALPAVGESTGCTVEAGEMLVQLGTTSGSIATPQVPAYSSETTKTLVLQLPEDTPETTEPVAADVQVDLKWDTPVSDFDLEVIGPDGTPYESIDVNAVTSPVETVSVPGVRQCDRIGVTAQNFAGSPLEALRLEVIASGSEF